VGPAHIGHGAGGQVHEGVGTVRAEKGFSPRSGIHRKMNSPACTLIFRSKVQPLAAAQAAGGPGGKTGTEIGGAFALQSEDRQELPAERGVSAILVLHVALPGWRRKSYGFSTYIAF